jgi:hypothetical protein
MSKRFIDTGIFDDPWFMELSKDAKILWIYMITRCDHAGIIEINKKLIQFHTEINSLDTVIEELSDRLVSLNKELKYFIPKFINFQYPDFPKSTVRQQVSALNIIKKHNLEKYLHVSVTKELTNSYGNGHGNGNGKGGVGEKPKNGFKYPSRQDFIDYLLQRNVTPEYAQDDWAFYVKNDWSVGKGVHWGRWQDAADQTVSNFKMQRKNEF